MALSATRNIPVVGKGLPPIARSNTLCWLDSTSGQIWLAVDADSLTGGYAFLNPNSEVER
jgi:hypothetical protein